MRYLILVLLASFAFSAELPADAKAFVDAYNTEIAKGYVPYKAMTVKANAKLEVDLKKLQDKYTKNGDLDNATLIKGIREKAKTDELLNDAENKARESVDKANALLTARVPIQLISATWEGTKNNKKKDVTKLLSEKYFNRKLNVIRVDVKDTAFGDIDPGSEKILTVVYTQGGDPITVTFGGRTPVLIPQE
jgi:hypothetical protein